MSSRYGEPRVNARTFLKSNRGSVAVMFASVAGLMIMAAGVSTDLMRAYSVKARLSGALDAAALAAGANTGTATQLQTLANNYLNANFPTSSGVTLTSTTINATTNPVTISATAAVPTTFLQAVGINTITVGASTAVQRQVSGLEVALVLDNTGSMMYPNTGAASSNMAALKKAAGQLVTQLFGSATTNNPLLRVALVPYTASVNPVPVVIPNGSTTSSAFATTLTQNSTFPSYVPSYFTYSQPAADYSSSSGNDANKWFGCVEESAAVKALGASPTTTAVKSALDTSVSSSSGAFTPYYWQAEITNNNKCYLASSHSTLASNGVCNTWSTGKSPNSSVTQLPWSWGSNALVGPNRSCPTPVTPLTNNLASLITAIGLNSDGSAKTSAGMGAWNNGGTQGSLGMAWGYRVLSPTGPYASISTINGWSTAQWKKVVVLMTDGVNDYFDNQYSGYGPYQSSFTTSQVDAQEKAVCDVLRANGVTIFTVFFNSNSTPGPAITYCAGTTPGSGDPNYYYNAQSQQALLNAFQTIGLQLTNLRITQ